MIDKIQKTLEDVRVLCNALVLLSKIVNSLEVLFKMGAGLFGALLGDGAQISEV